MTLAEAEIFFKRYNGHGFHMLREESKVYKKYNQLNIPKKQEDIWRVQKIEEYHERIHSDKENAWIGVGHIIEMMHDLEKVSDELLERLLDALAHISKLDMRQRILVMEDMEGRNNNNRNWSGYALYSSKKKYYEKLQKTMARITEINEEDRNEMEQLTASGKMGWTDTYNRYLTTLSRCERAEKSLLAGEYLENKSLLNRKGSQNKQQDEKYNYAEIWLALDKL